MIRCIAILVTLLSSTVARADDNTHQLTATVGVATPLGETGLEYAYVPSSHFEVAAGLGVANLLATGDNHARPLPQLAVMPRFRASYGRVTFTLGAGLSGGQYHEGPFAWNDSDWLTNALWGNGEAGARIHMKEWFAGLYAGVGVIIAHGAVHDLTVAGSPETRDCSEVTIAGMSCTPSFGPLPYVGLTFGRRM
jgi:hypothetical protein